MIPLIGLLCGGLACGLFQVVTSNDEEEFGTFDFLGEEIEHLRHLSRKGEDLL